MLAFLKLFLKFYLADTPHRRNASILEVGSEQLQVNIVLMNRDKSTETMIKALKSVVDSVLFIVQRLF